MGFIRVIGLETHEKADALTKPIWFSSVNIRSFGFHEAIKLDYLVKI